MKITIEIEFGNAAMQTYQDVGLALVDAFHPREMTSSGARDFQHPRVGDGAKIRDLNGNTVGGWVVVGKSDGMAQA